MPINATDGTGSFSAYVTETKTTPAGVVVLIQEIFGVNQAMRDIAAWVADLGFIATCPDLFWRIEPDIDITDKTDAEWKRAFELFQAFDQVKGIEDLKTTVAASRAQPGANGKVATMGYCLGGRLAFMMAEQSDADANISYYGVGLDGLLGDLGQGDEAVARAYRRQGRVLPAGRPNGGGGRDAGTQARGQLRVSQCRPRVCPGERHPLGRAVGDNRQWPQRGSAGQGVGLTHNENSGARQGKNTQGHADNAWQQAASLA
jgi:carboxymethylenebutenolidase